MKAAEEENVRITEFTVAPVIGDGRSYHEWFVEFENTTRRHGQLCKKG